MGFLSICSGLVAIVSVVIGVFLLTEIPKQLGFYTWIASIDPGFIGMTPAHNYNIPWGYTYDQYYSNCENIRGQNAVVTGANTGLGFSIAEELAKCGVNVVLTCRSVSKCEGAITKIKDAGSIKHEASLSMLIMDTSSLASVKDASQELVQRFTFQDEDGDSKMGTIDMVFFNAGRGIVLGEELDKDTGVALSGDGIESIFHTNVLGHHLMWRYISPLVENSKMGRVVMTSSSASFDPINGKVATSLEELHVPRSQFKFYGNSKLAQIVWAKKLTRMLPPESSIFANAAHPGAVDTAIWGKVSVPSFMDGFVEYMQKDAMWSSADGALTLLYLGVQTDELNSKNIRGKYFHPQTQEVVNEYALVEKDQDDLWKFCDELVSEYV